MWLSHAQSGGPFYIPTPGSRSQRKMAKKNGELASNSETTSQINISVPPSSTAPSPLNPHILTELLEPAVDGPPSPRRLRALSNKVKQGSFSDRHLSHQTTSSGSSSFMSADKPAWEQALESFSLSRKSSTRSTTSSMPSWERPESVQVFGKSIFSRRANLFRRESTSGATGSSGSSMYSNEMGPEAGSDRPRASSVTRDQLIPAIFSRRRTLQTSEDVAAQRKLQISNPFNFQHVTHTHKDQLPNLQRTNRVILQNEFSNLRASQLPSRGTLKGIQADELNFPNFSQDGLLEEDDTVLFQPPRTRNNSIARPDSSQDLDVSPRHIVAHTQSQEQLRRPPPRPPRSPPRSPSDLEFVPPVPPPRISSRSSSLSGEIEPIANMAPERPQTIGGFRRMMPIAMHVDSDILVPPVRPQPASPTTIAEHRYSRIFFPSSDDPNWPLACPPANASSFEVALPDVPEEEEVHGLPRRSRASVRSTNSSLRGSQSVPALRQSMSKQATTERHLSGESVILGHVDFMGGQRSLDETAPTMRTLQESPVLPRESWEDVIDYCYEHEAEADCDYEWDRPSLDLPRDSVDGLLSSDRPSSERFDLPALSPASHLSSGSVHEAITPTIPATAAKSPTASNFSFPRRDRRLQPQRLLHVRTPSQASSFKESQGFTLSPSLLIPNEYHQELLAAHQAENSPDPDAFTHAVPVPYEEPTLTMDTSKLFVQSRSSASTTASASNESTRSGFERHISTTSTNTDYTRLTMSSASINMEEFIHKIDSAPQPQSAPVSEPETVAPEPVHARAKSVAGLLTSSQVPAHAGGGSARSLGNGHYSDPTLSTLHSPHRQAGRARSNTTSLASPPRPGQFALFPNTSAMGPRMI